MPLSTPTLSTARLRLRPFTEADADALFALHSNAEVLRYWDRSDGRHSRLSSPNTQESGTSPFTTQS
ncbi:GNAT family N-acetyltransferase [Nocardioides sp. DS6]|uniref:GNAT family N-acetyltransferase n=1 Tax=Nocardioides eburneus TaxID=3231482 RepID=A0ABV3T1J0_9ACTN